MATAKAQSAWRERNRTGVKVRRCQCGKKLREESKEICQACWKKTPEGKAYNQHQVAIFASKFDHVAEAKSIANKYKQELGFVNSAALVESDLKGCLEVIKGIGFAHFHHRRDAQTTIYSLAVLKDKTRSGWGRLLFYRVLCSAIENGSKSIVAKCPEDLPSNQFYEAMGFNLRQSEPGKKRRLNVWQYSIDLPLLFYCADGGRNEYGRIAKEEGWRMGFQSEQICPGSHVQMIDNEYMDYDHDRHLAMVKKHKPLIATAQDIMDINDLPRILKQARELSQYCGRVLLIPKVKSWLPKGFWLAYSIPTSHGGTQIEPEWFRDRPVHLLGGSPKAQAQYSKLLNVVSLDGNYATNLAKTGNVTWQYGEEKIQRLTGEKGCYPAFRESLKRQKRYWHEERQALWSDTPLFSILS